MSSGSNHSRPLTGISRRPLWWTWMMVLGAVASIVTLGYILLVEAPAPRSVVFAAGAKDGRYYSLAGSYARELEHHGIRVEVRETHGSEENLKLLEDPTSGVSVALIQGGIAKPSEETELRALGSLYREPFWLFVRNDLEATRMGQLAGKRVAIGADGSGTRRVARQLFEASGVTADRVTLVDIGGMEAAEQLENGAIDAACFVASVDAGYIQKLGLSSQVRLLNMDDGEALSRRFRHLSSVRIPAGLLDLPDHAPPTDVSVVAPAAMLVAHESLHPALTTALLEAAHRIHSKGDALSAPGEFPSSKYLDIPLSKDADQYYRHGPPLLQRLLPFWLAVFVDRMKLLALPLVVLAMPLIRATPPLLRWRTRRKIYLWYTQLRELDHRMFEGMTAGEAQESLHQLQSLEAQVSRVEIPLSYMEEYYNLRTHLNLVQERLRGIIQRGA
ncbi:MAG: TAXI family TRAP transporter solute-binding subunit [Planctomycetaceae bacterium]|nr:TAXI family TRAP transporter solute-binding subunit [Planctomycetaceae bacterium]